MGLELLKEQFLDKKCDDVMFWVQCPKYQDEITDIKEDIIEDNNGRMVKHVTFLFGDTLDMYTGDISDDLYEWSRLITELSENEIELFELKEKYELASEKIIDETDFKAIYGKNNAEVRKQHVKSRLYADYLVIKDLEFSIDYLKRRISYLKQLIHTKTVIREVKE